MALYLVVLFIVLTPGVFVRLPPKAGKLTVALTHAVVFAVVYQLTNSFVSQALEGFAARKSFGEACSKNVNCITNLCRNAKCDKNCDVGDGTPGSLCKTSNDCRMLKDGMCSPQRDMNGQIDPGACGKCTGFMK